jgi:hypothetical protein
VTSGSSVVLPSDAEQCKPAKLSFESDRSGKDESTDERLVDRLWETTTSLTVYHTNEAARGPTMLKVLSVFICLRLWEDGIDEADYRLSEALRVLDPGTAPVDPTIPVATACTIFTNCNLAKSFVQS